MYTITKQFEFAASHVLAGLPEGHQCGRLHGHNYIVEVELQSKELDATGFVVDYGRLATFGDYLKANFDHRHLNDIMKVNPTAENLARHLYGIARDMRASFSGMVTAVRVSETPKTWATYSPDPEEGHEDPDPSR